MITEQGWQKLHWGGGGGGVNPWQWVKHVRLYSDLLKALTALDSQLAGP